MPCTFAYIYIGMYVKYEICGKFTKSNLQQLPQQQQKTCFRTITSITIEPLIHVNATATKTN